MKKLTLHNLNIAYKDMGAGDPVILVHCSSASHRQWIPLANKLQANFRVLLPDLIGYGQSDTWPEDKPFEPGADAAIIRELINIAQQPVHIVAHSYGAAMAIEATKNCSEQVRTLTVIEPVSFRLLKLCNRDAEWRQVQSLASKVIHACDTDNQPLAAKHFMQYWIGKIAWMFTAEKAKDEIIRTINKVAKEFTILTDDSIHLDDYKNFSINTHLIMGEKTPSTARAVVEVLYEILPNVCLTTIPKAGHMSPFTHKESIYKIVEDTLCKSS